MVLDCLGMMHFCVILFLYDSYDGKGNGVRREKGVKPAYGHGIRLHGRISLTRENKIPEERLCSESF